MLPNLAKVTLTQGCSDLRARAKNQVIRIILKILAGLDSADSEHKRSSNAVCVYHTSKNASVPSQRKAQTQTHRYRITKHRPLGTEDNPDAVNVGQMNNHNPPKLAKSWRKSRIERSVYGDFSARVIASADAVADPCLQHLNLVKNRECGCKLHEGITAMAVGNTFFRISKTGKWVLKASVSGNGTWSKGQCMGSVRVECFRVFSLREF